MPPPVVDSVTIDQSAPDTDDVLGVTVDASDDDGDTLTYDYQWTNGGVDISGETGATLDLGDLGDGDRGDDIAVRVTASDAGSTSDAVTSDAVTVANSGPVVTQLTVTPAMVGRTSTVVATVSLAVTQTGIPSISATSGSSMVRSFRPRRIGDNLQDSLDLTTLDGVDLGEIPSSLPSRPVT